MARNCTQTETHTHIRYTHTNRSAHTQTHKAAEKSQRMPRHTKFGEYLGGGGGAGVLYGRSGVRQRHHTAHSRHNPDLYSCSFVDFAKTDLNDKKGKHCRKRDTNGEKEAR